MLEFTRPLGPFAVLYEDRVTPDSKQAPAKRGPKTKIKRTKIEQSAMTMETPEERKARHAQERAHKTAMIIKRAPYSDAARNCPSQADRTNVITGRRPGARFQ